MALKKTIKTEYGNEASYEDVFVTQAVNVNGIKTLSVHLRGWTNKKNAREGNKYIWDNSYCLTLTKEERNEFDKLVYSFVKAHVTEFVDAEPVYDVDSVTLDKSEVTLKAGKKATLTATCTPDTAEDLTVSWKSSDESIATVADGVVTAVAAGTATITAASNDEPKITASCSVTVL